jgi:Glycyl-tRNA synthetase, beta subunit
VFQERLGTVYEKVERVRALAASLARMAGADEEVAAVVDRAAYLAKADLVTQMVYEFPELQGVMGREYALLSGEGEAVADAVFEHYLPRFAGDELPRTLAGSILSVADKLDTIVGCFGVDLIPTGSQDPYALRRQALGVVRIVSGFPLEIHLGEALSAALAAFGGRFDDEADALLQRVMDFFAQRVRGMLLDQGVRHDLVEAVVGAGIDDLGRRVRQSRRPGPLQRHRRVRGAGDGLRAGGQPGGQGGCR